MVLQVKGLYFTVKGTHFQVDHILHAHSNTRDGVKYFSNFIYTRNKQTLNKQRILLTGIFGHMGLLHWKATKVNKQIFIIIIKNSTLSIH